MRARVLVCELVAETCSLGSAEGAVLGGDHWVVQVNGKGIKRQQHGEVKNCYGRFRALFHFGSLDPRSAW